MAQATFFTPSAVSEKKVVAVRGRWDGGAVAGCRAAKDQIARALLDIRLR